MKNTCILRESVLVDDMLQSQLVLDLFLFFYQFRGSCSYKTFLLKTEFSWCSSLAALIWYSSGIINTALEQLIHTQI